jgi:pimeloyl-ACP methyl ester carboxylesterase
VRGGAPPPVRCPTLGVWSSGDRALVEAQMAASGAFVAPGRWRYVRLEGPGHWIPRDAPAQLSELLLGFLGEGRGGGGGEGGNGARARL